MILREQTGFQSEKRITIGIQVKQMRFKWQKLRFDPQIPEEVEMFWVETVFGWNNHALLGKTKEKQIWPTHVLSRNMKGCFSGKWWFNQHSMRFPNQKCNKKEISLTRLTSDMFEPTHDGFYLENAVVCQQETVDNLAKQEHSRSTKSSPARCGSKQSASNKNCTYKNPRKKRIWFIWIIDSSG